MVRECGGNRQESDRYANAHPVRRAPDHETQRLHPRCRSRREDRTAGVVRAAQASAGQRAVRHRLPSAGGNRPRSALGGAVEIHEAHFAAGRQSRQRACRVGHWSLGHRPRGQFALPHRPLRLQRVFQERHHSVQQQGTGGGERRGRGAGRLPAHGMEARQALRFLRRPARRVRRWPHRAGTGAGPHAGLHRRAGGSGPVGQFPGRLGLGGDPRVPGPRLQPQADVESRYRHGVAGGDPAHPGGWYGNHFRPRCRARSGS